MSTCPARSRRNSLPRNPHSSKRLVTQIWNSVVGCIDRSRNGHRQPERRNIEPRHARTKMAHLCHSATGITVARIMVSALRGLGSHGRGLNIRSPALTVWPDKAHTPARSAYFVRHCCWLCKHSRGPAQRASADLSVGRPRTRIRTDVNIRGQRQVKRGRAPINPCRSDRLRRRDLNAALQGPLLAHLAPAIAAPLAPRSKRFKSSTIAIVAPLLYHLVIPYDPSPQPWARNNSNPAHNLPRTAST